MTPKIQQELKASKVIDWFNFSYCFTNSNSSNWGGAFKDQKRRIRKLETDVRSHRSHFWKSHAAEDCTKDVNPLDDTWCGKVNAVSWTVPPPSCSRKLQKQISLQGCFNLIWLTLIWNSTSDHHHKSDSPRNTCTSAANSTDLKLFCSTAITRCVEFISSTFTSLLQHAKVD